LFFAQSRAAELRQGGHLAADVASELVGGVGRDEEPVRRLFFRHGAYSMIR